MLTPNEEKALREEIPMTQEIFDSIVDKCVFYGLLDEADEFALCFPDFMVTHAENFLEKMDQIFPEEKHLEITEEKHIENFKHLIQRITNSSNNA